MEAEDRLSAGEESREAPGFLLEMDFMNSWGNQAKHLPQPAAISQAPLAANAVQINQSQSAFLKYQRLLSIWASHQKGDLPSPYLELFAWSLYASLEGGA